MSSPIDNNLQGYKINWTRQSEEGPVNSPESLSDYASLKKDLFERYPDFEPLEIFMAHFESLHIEDDHLKPDSSLEALESLQDLEEICWALDLKMTLEPSR